MKKLTLIVSLFLFGILNESEVAPSPIHTYTANLATLQAPVMQLIVPTNDSLTYYSNTFNIVESDSTNTSIALDTLSVQLYNGAAIEDSLKAYITIHYTVGTR